MQHVTKLTDDCHGLVDCAECPSLLWHYTDVASAIKIIETSSVRLTCHASMNDPTEGFHAPTLVSTCWNAALDRLQSEGHVDGHAIDFLRGASVRTAKRYSDYLPHLPPSFVFSTTTLDDSLSQWSRYGSDGAGIALGLQIVPGNLSLTADGTSDGLRVCKVVYDPGPQGNSTAFPGDVRDAYDNLRTKLSDVLHQYARSIRDNSEPDGYLILAAHLLRPVVKQGAYHEEREWRIVGDAREEETSRYDVRATRYGIAPYMKIPFGQGLRLEKIVLGPRLSGENEWTARWLCRKHGFQPEISRSTFTYR